MEESGIFHFTPSPFVEHTTFDTGTTINYTNVFSDRGDGGASYPVGGLNFNEKIIIDILSSNLTSANNNETNGTISRACQPWPPYGANSKFLSIVYYEIEQKYARAVLVLGIIFNILTLLTLRQKSLKRSAYVHLSGLAVADLTVLVLSLLDQLREDRWAWLVFRVYVYYPLSNIASMSGVWIMVIVTLERCICIRSMWVRVWCTPSRARVTVLIVCAITLIINIPRFVWFKVGPSNRPCGFQWAVLPNLQKWPRAKIVSWTWSTLVNFLPLFLLIVFNTFLIFSLNTRKRQRPQLGIAESADTVWNTEQTKLTITLITIVFLFIILVMPSAFADTSILLPLCGLTRMTDSTKAFQHISNMLLWINMSINFVMYGVLNTKFRKALTEMTKGWFWTAVYWLTCYRCRSDDPAFSNGRYFSRHHRNHRNGHTFYNHYHYRPASQQQGANLRALRLSSSTRSNGSTSGDQSYGDSLGVTRPMIQLNGEDCNGNNKIHRKSETSSCGRGMSAVKSIFTGSRKRRRDRSSDSAFPLQPSFKSTSTGTGISSSTTPSEGTEICPMSDVAPSPTVLETIDQENPLYGVLYDGMGDAECAIALEMIATNQSYATSKTTHAESSADDQGDLSLAYHQFENKQYEQVHAGDKAENADTLSFTVENTDGSRNRPTASDSLLCESATPQSGVLETGTQSDSLPSYEQCRVRQSQDFTLSTESQADPETHPTTEESPLTVL